MAAISAGREAQRRKSPLRIAAFDGARRIGAKILVAGGGRCNVTHHQVGFLMPGKGKHTDTKTKSYTKYDVTGYPDDPFDDRLYAAVKERLDKEVAEHGISDDACPFVDSHDAQRRFHLETIVAPDSDRPAPDDHNSSLVGAEDAWVDAEAVRRFGIKLEDPEGGPGRRAIWQGHPS